LAESEPTPTDSCACCGGALEVEPRIHGVDRVLPTPGEFDIRVCTNCGTGKTFPIAQEDELGAFYEGGYGNFQDVEEDPSLLKLIMAIPSRLYQWRLRNCMPLSAARGGGRFLDIGCGSGWVSELFAKDGWEVEGIEPSPVACAETAARGIKVHQGTINTVELPEESFDAVLFFHSLEHTVDPRHDLRRAARLLRPGGKMLIAVPNFGSAEAKRFGTYWYPLELPRHRTHFTDRGLAKLLESEGFDVEQRTTGTPLLSLPISMRIKHSGDANLKGRLSYLIVAAISLPLQPLTGLYGRLRGGCAYLNMSATKRAR
jgi:SAM-dependent methyltransferase